MSETPQTQAAEIFIDGLTGIPIGLTNFLNQIQPMMRNIDTRPNLLVQLSDDSFISDLKLSESTLQLLGDAGMIHISDLTALTADWFQKLTGLQPVDVLDVMIRLLLAGHHFVDPVPDSINDAATDGKLYIDKDRKLSADGTYTYAITNGNIPVGKVHIDDEGFTASQLPGLLPRFAPSTYE